ncbi:major facilitator superfamily transporter [Colletotrichum lupini]|uniref:Major facilitator superfamily transporter n=1 Tax=Colletotrichum lupini TaxID=145971 RepID=A0A9Q8WAL0_9PEZI|nr:major facilitator superfamily transporter [Colletotrichum lupini]UQC76161.1 major facilitator superfamily transporter [Colletotrichum lupini]
MLHDKHSLNHRVSADGNGEPLGRRTSALKEAPTFVPPASYPSMPVTRRRSTVSQTSRVTLEHDQSEDLDELVRSASAISRHRSRDRRESKDSVFELPAFPKAAKPGPVSTIREVPSQFTTPQSTRPPSPVSGVSSGPPSPGGRSGTQTPAKYEIGAGQAYPDVGTVASFRGAIVLLCTYGAQLMDNIFITAVNIALPAIQKDFKVKNAELQWLISAYTLTFSSFLLLAGVFADRFGRKMIFCASIATLSVWTIANSFATSFIQLAIFRALQGIGAAMTMPSAVGIISNYFIAKDRTLALTIFSATGAGLLPKDRLEGTAKPKLDFVSASLSTASLILLSFVLSSGVVSIAIIVTFTYVKKKKLENFAALWIGGFVSYGGYQTTIYYTTLIAQEVNQLSAGQTALRFLPMGATGFIFSLSMSRMLEIFNTKLLLVIGMAICAIAPIPSALMRQDDLNFWKHVFPTTVMGVAGVTIVYYTITVVLLASVPVNVKSLCGGIINTAFQISGGVSLALAGAVVQAVDTGKGHSDLRQYNTGLLCCYSLASIGMIASAFGVKNISKAVGGPAPLGIRFLSESARSLRIWQNTASPFGIPSIITTLTPYHIISYGTLLGTSLFQTFINTKICYLELPKSAFTTLQKRLFPIYFRYQALLLVLTVLTFSPHSPTSLFKVKSN